MGDRRHELRPIATPITGNLLIYESGLSQGLDPLCIAAALAASTAIWLSLRKTVSDWAEAAEAGVEPELAI